MYTRPIASILFAVCAMVAIAAPVSADTNEQPIDRTYFSGTATDLTRDVNGDVFCFNETTTIRSTITGDVICASGEVHLHGTITGDARVLADTVVVHGTIAGSLSVVANSVTIDKNAVIGKDVSGVTQVLTVEGTVARDIVATATTMTVRGDVGRDINSTVQNLEVARSASVAGWVRHYNTTSVDVHPDAAVATVKEYSTLDGAGSSSRVAAAIAFGLLTIGVFSVSIALIAPQPVHRTITRARKQPLITLLTGAGVGVVVPVFATLFLFSGLMAPFGLLLLFVWAAVLIASIPIGIYGVGHTLLRTQTTNIAVLALVGAGISVSVLVIPIINVLFVLFLLLFGAGAIAQQIFHAIGTPNYMTVGHEKIK